MSVSGRVRARAGLGPQNEACLQLCIDVADEFITSKNPERDFYK